jgi:hypothetical protein
VDAHHKLSHVLGESFGNHLLQSVIVVPAEKAQPASALFPLANEPGRVYGHLVVANSLPIVEGDECLVAIGGGRSFAMLTKPALYLLWREVGCRTGA